MATDLPRYFLLRKPKDLRRQKLLPVDMTKATAVRFEMGNRTVLGLTRSSSTSTWVATGANAAVSEEWAGRLMTKLGEMYVFDFVGQDPGPKVTSLQTPFVKMVVATGGESVSAVIGATLPADNDKDQRNYYAQTEGREAVLIMSGRLVDELLDVINSRR